jgi:glycosyltransferase involved in cell wall biosynthesis
MPTIKVMHLTVVRKLSAGQRKQLGDEVTSSRNLDGIDWETVAFHCSKPVEPFEYQIPVIFRPVILRSLYAWLIMLRFSRRCDFLLCRHLVFDPFVLLFGRMVKNRITIHHAKEIDELKLIRPGLTGTLASILESVTGRIAVRSARAVVGVTHDISRYQVSTRARSKESFVYPNGVITQLLPLLNDRRDPNRLNFVFICGTFSPWHGLDLLIDGLRAYAEGRDYKSQEITVHLIGSLSVEQKSAISELNSLWQVVKIYGSLTPQEYLPILETCDCGIGSLAMDREGLTEGATLKVREYLASGLPVYSGHQDTAIPQNFPFYLWGCPSVFQMVQFAAGMRGRTRDEVRCAAAPYIEKRVLMQNLSNWLKGFSPR